MAIRNWLDLMKLHATRQHGQTMAEYSVVLAVITLGVMAAIGFLALAITGKLGTVTKTLTGA